MSTAGLIWDAPIGVWLLTAFEGGQSGDRLHGPSPRRPWRSIFLIFGWVEWAGTGPPGQVSTTFSVHFLLFLQIFSSFFVFSHSFFPSTLLFSVFGRYKVFLAFTLLSLIFPPSVERDFSSFRLFVAIVLSSPFFRQRILLGIFAAYNNFLQLHLI